MIKNNIVAVEPEKLVLHFHNHVSPRFKIYDTNMGITTSSAFKFCNQFFSRKHVPCALFSNVGDLSILPLLGGLYESQFFIFNYRWLRIS